jgi:hypothetical protein
VLVVVVVELELSVYQPQLVRAVMVVLEFLAVLLAQRSLVLGAVVVLGLLGVTAVMVVVAMAR